MKGATAERGTTQENKNGSNNVIDSTKCFVNVASANQNHCGDNLIVPETAVIVVVTVHIVVTIEIVAKTTRVCSGFKERFVGATKSFSPLGSLRKA